MTQKEREREDVYVFGAKWIVEASANANVDEQR